MFCILLYFHTGRGISYTSSYLTETWYTGVVILLIVIAVAFIGYVLLWGQMSFWGVTVITNLLSAIPYLGSFLVQWIWGGFAVDNATPTRFFTIHFLLPFLILGLVRVHLLFLHQTGSNNPIGVNSNYNQTRFHPFYSSKDLTGLSFILPTLLTISLLLPYTLGDVENFIPANPLVTPVHIQPEWYFLFAYAILPSIPNKLGGVICLVLSIVILIILPLTETLSVARNNKFTLNQFLFWNFLLLLLLATTSNLNWCPTSWSSFHYYGSNFNYLLFFLFLNRSDY